MVGLLLREGRNEEAAAARCERQTGFGFGRASAEKRLSMSPEHKPRRASEAKTVVARRRTTDIKVSRYGERTSAKTRWGRVRLPENEK